MTVAITKAVRDGVSAVMCASTGNTSASAAAYAARAGLKSFVLIPEGKIALGKLAQAIMHGARVIALEGNFDQALKIVREITARFEVALVNSINPYRLEGQKTAAFEVVDVLGEAPDFLFIPVGNAGNITAYWLGFCQYYEVGRAKKLPKMCGFQAAGAAPIVLGRVVEHPETFATAIRIGNPARWKEAEAAAFESGGYIDMVTDEEIRKAYDVMAEKEGIFCEPASAASVAGLLKAARDGRLEKGSVCVCVLTGHGLKDPDSATVGADLKVVKLPAEYEVVENYLLEKEGMEPR
jgi:threonine synthase